MYILECILKNTESKGIKVFNTPAASSQSVAELEI